jgi:hypothetical protein
MNVDDGEDSVHAVCVQIKRRGDFSSKAHASERHWFADFCAMRFHSFHSTTHPEIRTNPNEMNESE